MTDLITAAPTGELATRTSPHAAVLRDIVYGRESTVDDAVFVCDLADVRAKMAKWVQMLPRVHAHYAVKCNPDIVILSQLARLGTGFDCASKAEIELVMGLPDVPVSADRVIFAHPCKPASHILFAAAAGVDLMTFDNEDELVKIKALFPTAKLVLRLMVDDSMAVCRLSNKFGCAPEHTRSLLEAAQRLELHVVGVSFHVGSGSTDAHSFAVAVRDARRVFDQAESLGMELALLDIGGGFPGHSPNAISFEEIAAPLAKALDVHFPAESGVRIIAEPGRFFAASACTLAVNVIARRHVQVASSSQQDIEDGMDSGNESEAGSARSSACSSPSPALLDQWMLYVNDGLYGSFNCLLYDHAEVEPRVLALSCDVDNNDRQQTSCSIWGPTCDGLDCITKAATLPEVRVGEWLYFENMGAYTLSAGSTFNGFERPTVFHINVSA